MIKNIKVNDESNEAFINSIQDSYNSNNNEISVELYQGKNKAGKSFEAIKLTIGEYETLVFPERFAMKYIKTLL